MMKFWLFVAAIALTLTANAQGDEVQVRNYVVSDVKAVNFSEITEDWAPKLQHLEAPTPGGNSYKSYLEEVKQQIPGHHYNTGSTSAKTGGTDDTNDPPSLHRNFRGNIYDFGVPNDNDMAISNDGFLVSVVNSSISIFHVEQDSLYGRISLEAFTDSSLGEFAHKFDPRAVYDPKQDRFILVYLSGSQSDENAIIVAFSATNDPTGIWYQYALEGNPYSNNSWSDYPIIAITDDELYVTVNLIRDDSSWQAGFVESLIWQCDKNAGFAGTALGTNLYNNVNFGGKPIRNLCPVGGGETTYGPNLYLLSNRNFDMENDTIFIIELDAGYSSTPANVSIGYSLSDNAYGVPPNAEQTLGFLATNDARILDAFIEDDWIQFVGNTVVPATGKAGIFHGVIHNVGWENEIQLTILDDDHLEFGYPNVTYTGRYDGDLQSIITFNHVSADSFPGISAIFYERWAGYSDRLHIYSGSDYVNVLAGSTERWGDYSGGQRKYNEEGVMWMSGFYGIRKGFNRVNETWIAELESPGSTPVSVKPATQTMSASLYPNPVPNKAVFQFSLEETEVLDISVYNMSGQLVKILFRDKGKAGLNMFTFTTDYLAAGQYVLRVQGEEGQLYSEKFVVTPY